MSYDLKDPQAKVDYAVDWRADGYLQDGESIVSSAWLVEPAGELSVVAGSETVIGDVTKCAVENGVFARIYRLTNRVTFAGGGGSRVDDRSWIIRMGHQ